VQLYLTNLSNPGLRRARAGYTMVETKIMRAAKAHGSKTCYLTHIVT
jgi:hypothetical protein